MDNIEEPEALWAFSPTGLQVRKQEDGWGIDWPETESYKIGPASIAWILWHIIYWWSTAIDYNFGDGVLKKKIFIGREVLKKQNSNKLTTR